MVTKDFERWLGVRVVSWLELQVGYTDLLEEDLDDSHQMSQTNILVGDQTFALVELGQVSSIQSLVSEDSVDGEVFDWLELLLLSKFVKHLRTDSSGVSSQQILLSLFMLPLILVALGTKTTSLMNLLDFLGVVSGSILAVSRILQEESVMCISSRVRLRLEEGIEVPERALDVPISWHFLETHLHENLFELLSNLKQRMEVASIQLSADSLIIVVLELEVLPGTGPQHIASNLSFQLYSLRSELGSFGDSVRLDGFNVQVLTLLVLCNQLFIVRISRWVINKILQVLLVLILNSFSNSDESLAFFFDPLLLHSLTTTDFRDLSTNTLFHLWQLNKFTNLHGRNELEFWRTVLDISASLIGQLNQFPFNDVKLDVLFRAE